MGTTYPLGTQIEKLATDPTRFVYALGTLVQIGTLAHDYRLTIEYGKILEHKY